MRLSIREFLGLDATSPGIETDEFARFERAFFTDIRTSNGSWKTTEKGRLAVVDDALFEVLERTGTAPRVVMDVGISSGATTVDWIAAFERRGVAVEVIATDRTMSCYLARLGPNLDVLFETDGYVLRADAFGCGVRPWCSRRDYVLGLCLLKSALARHIRSMCRRRGVSFPLDRSRAAAAQRTVVSGPFQLVTPALRGRPNVVLADDDVLAPTPPEFVAAADVVRLANIVQRVYFTDAQVATIVRNVRARCRDGALVVVCRNKPDAIEGSILSAVPGGGFELERRIGAGSEVEGAFCAT